MTTSEEIREREAKENAAHIKKARELGRPVTFIGDGYEVTCFPDGRVAFNMADWY